MKLSNVPSVRVATLVDRIELFLNNNNIPTVEVGSRRRKALETWYSQTMSNDSKYAAARGKFDPEEQMLRFQWERVVAGGKQTSTLFVTLREAKDIKLDPVMRATAAGSQWLHIRVYHRGHLYRSFWWYLLRNQAVKEKNNKGASP